MENNKPQAKTSVSTIKLATKTERVLAALLTSSLNRFQAEEIGDHALNSTISTLANKYDLMIERTPIKLVGRFGNINCNRYWISKKNLEAAEKLLTHFRKRRGICEEVEDVA